MKRVILAIIILLPFAYLGLRNLSKTPSSYQPQLISNDTVMEVEEQATLKVTHPLMIEVMREKEYPGSDIKIEQKLTSGSNYKKYVTSYISDGLKIYAMLTVPNGNPPEGGWPVLIFNHGYIPPEQYSTTQRYEAYVDYFARNGYVVFKPDYRGHGKSEGTPTGGYYSPAYTEDVLNAVSSVKNYPGVNSDRIGMWGHSMGGHLTLRSMVVSKDIKAGVIWAGVVTSYEEMMTSWRRNRPWQPSSREQNSRRPSRDELVKEYGSFEENGSFWQSISPIYFVKDISGPIQLHHGTADAEVPVVFSESLKKALDAVGKPTELFIYEQADHNLSGAAFGKAMERSLKFFNDNI